MDNQEITDKLKQLIVGRTITDLQFDIDKQGCVISLDDGSWIWTSTINVPGSYDKEFNFTHWGQSCDNIFIEKT